MKVKLAHLYPDKMNIYGDWGNIITIKKRLEWRGHEVDYQRVEVGDSYDFTDVDIVFGGGGQDKGQIEVADDLQRHADNIHKAVSDGGVFLLVCGLYQLFGRRFTTSNGAELPGIGVFEAETFGSSDRLIGNVTIGTSWGNVVGFENHSGKTELSTSQSALGRVIRGHGNNGKDGFEGAIVGNTFGTYLHGPLLPKNPIFCDQLLKRALTRRKANLTLDGLDDKIAFKAAEVAKNLPQ